MKDDMRKEFVGKIEFDNLNNRVLLLEEAAQELREDIERHDKKFKDHQERLEGHATRLSVDTDLITEL